MSDEDLRAFATAPAAKAPRPRRLWPWLLAAGLLLVALVVAGSLVALVSWLDAGREGWHVSIDGEEWHGGAWEGLLALLGVAGGLGVALLAVGLVVPLALGLAAAGVALALALGLGGVLLAVALLLGVLLSPLWGLLLVAWLVWRRRPAATVAP